MNNVKALRTWLNMTQQHLAKELKVSPSTVIAWENNTRKPSLNNLISLARLANLRLEDVLTFDIEITRKEPAENDLSLYPAENDNDRR